MQKKPITEKDVQEILKYRDNYLNLIHENMFTIQKEIQNTDDIIMSVSLPTYHEVGVQAGTGIYTGLEIVYEEYREILTKRKEEYVDMFFHLIEEEMSIERVWMCFLALREPYFTILNELYVKKQLYSATEKVSGLSHPVFERKRKEGIERIMRYYNSDKSASELGELSELPKFT